MMDRLRPATRYVDANGLKLRCLEWGPVFALPIVCVHGYTSSAEAFNSLARHLQDAEDRVGDTRVIAIAVRGHGDSAWSPDAA